MNIDYTTAKDLLTLFVENYNKDCVEEERILDTAVNDFFEDVLPKKRYSNHHHIKNCIMKMDKEAIMDHLHALQKKVDSMGFKGQNEYDLQLREEIAEWLLNQQEISKCKHPPEQRIKRSITDLCRLCGASVAKIKH